MTTQAYVNIVLTNLGVNAEPLNSAVVAYMKIAHIQVAPTGAP